MISLVLLVCFVGAAVSQSSSSSDSSTSGLLERLANGQKLIFDLDSADPVTSEDDDDDDAVTSSSSSSSLFARILRERQENKDRRDENRKEGAEIAAILRGARNPTEEGSPIRESYQAVFKCEDCVEDDVALGPVVMIAKTTAQAVQLDHFDNAPNGPDGFDDVAFALNRWQETTNVAQRKQRLEEFLIQVRNRATVNGGSIGLQALILTGTQKLPNGQDSGNDATFGGAADRQLISPCIPVINDRPLFAAENPKLDSREEQIEALKKNDLITNGGYNLQIFGQVQGQPVLFTVDNAAERVPLSFFFSNDEFVEKTATLGLKIFVDEDENEVTDLTDDAIEGLQDTFGELFFEKCTRFSYFN